MNFQVYFHCRYLYPTFRKIKQRIKTWNSQYFLAYYNKCLPYFFVYYYECLLYFLVYYYQCLPYFLVYYYERLLYFLVYYFKCLPYLLSSSFDLLRLLHLRMTVGSSLNWQSLLLADCFHCSETEAAPKNILKIYKIIRFFCQSTKWTR